MLIDPARVRFPARCASCGGTPERERMLSGFRGIDLLLFRWGYGCEIAVPTCRGCAATRPVWIRGWKQHQVELGFADAKLAEDVAVASGLAAPMGNYREAPIPPKVWSRPRRSLPWWTLLLAGAIFFAVAAGEFVQYAQLERSGESFSDQMIFVWIYELGGKWLLSGILTTLGALLVAGGFFLRKKTL